MADFAPRSSLSCCLYCGRDTYSRHGVCRRCLGHPLETLFGRKYLPSTYFSASPLEFIEEEEPHHPTPVELYHGSTIRDDL